jgi:hypothetical protein
LLEFALIVWLDLQEESGYEELHIGGGFELSNLAEYRILFTTINEGQH